MDTALWVCGMSEPPQTACKAAPSGSVPAGRRGCRRVRGVAVVLLLAVGGLLAPPVWAQTVILVSNIEDASNGLGDGSTRIAQRFTTGRHADGYTLTNVAIRYADAAGDAFAAQVCAVQAVGTDQPDLSACTPLTLTGSFPMSSALSTVYFIGVIDLEPETKYTVVLTPATGATVTYGITTSDAETSKQDRWNIAGEYRIESGSDWNAQSGSSAFKIEVTGTITIPDALVSNIGTGGAGATGRDGVAVGDTSSATYIQAQKFRTGTHPAGYRLTGLRFYVDSLSSNNVTPQVSLYTAGSGGNPGTSLYVFTGTLTTTGYTTLSAPADATLEPDTDYFVHFEDTNHATVPDRGRYNVRNVASATEDTASRPGWSIADVRHEKRNTDAWQSIGSNLPWLGIWLRGEVNESAIPTSVPATWGLIPTGLTVGDQFRLIFLSSTKRDGRSTEIATYNTFVRNRAEAGHTAIRAYSSGFRVVGCTHAVDARDNTDTLHTSSDRGVPIYWLNGNKVADDYADFYNGSWDDEANDKNESGTDGPDTSDVDNYPFTGCIHNGTEENNRELGNASDVRLGRPNSSGPNHGPIGSTAFSSPGNARPMYGLSQVFEVAASTNTLPNRPPVFEGSSAERELGETVAASIDTGGRPIGAALTATDADTDTLTYSLGGPDAGQFEINAHTGQLETKAGVRYDYEARPRYTVRVTADDSRGGTATLTVTIVIQDVNEPPEQVNRPTVEALSRTELGVSWPAPANIGRPPITGYDLQYLFSGDYIDGPQGVRGTQATLTGLRPGERYEVFVRATNADGYSPDWSEARSGRTEANNPPVFMEGTDTTRVLPETEGAAVVRTAAALGAALTASDADMDRLVYRLEAAGQDAAKFSLDPSSGQLRTTVGERYDYEEQRSYTVTVTATDVFGGPARITVTITVEEAEPEPPLRPVAPTVTSSDPTELEVTWTAPDNVGRPDIMHYSLQYRAVGTSAWTALPDYVVSQPPVAGARDPISGLEAATNYEVQVQAHNADGAGPWSPTGRGQTNTVGNAAPEILGDFEQARSLAETVGAATESPARELDEPFTATDPDTDPLRYTLAGQAAGQFTLDGNTGQLRTRVGQRYDHEAGEERAVIVKVEDGQGGSAAALVTVTITDETEPPLAPAAPRVTTATGPTPTLRVSWRAPNNVGRPRIESYNLQYRANATDSWTAGPQEVVGTSEEITDLPTTTGYEVQVQAHNADGDSDWSPVGRRTTTRPPPPPPRGGGGGGSSRDDHGDTAAQATAVRVESSAPWGSSTAGQLNTTSDVDYFTLAVPQAGLLVVETTGATATRGTVWQDGVELGQAASGGERQNFRLSVPVEAGPVVIAVQSPGQRTGSYTLETTLLVGYLENPGPESFQSGVGVISGWVCGAEGVEIEINGTPQPAAYGTERTDTVAICGEPETGFGVLFNWNLLGDGAHEVVAYVDDVELGRATVTVTTLGEEFVRGVTGACTVPDFPSPGERVSLVWQQSQQNFVLADGMAPSGANRSGTPGVGYLENPGPDSFQSGVGVLSGWVCAAETVTLAIGEVPPQVAAYGTERLDTQAACGDTDNGFGLLFNWNLLGDGEHAVVAYVDEEELGRATVRVTTLGAEFLRGVEGECAVEDFPTPGETVTLAWQQNQQNFVVTAVE